MPIRYLIILGIWVCYWLSQLFVLQDYQQARLLNFLFPDEYRHGNAYNVEQALITISSGLLGQGYGNALSPAVFKCATDFIFSVAAEFGFWEQLSPAFIFIIWRCLVAAREASDLFGSLIAYSYATMLFSGCCKYWCQFESGPGSGYHFVLLWGAHYFPRCLGLG